MTACLGIVGRCVKNWFIHIPGRPSYTIQQYRDALERTRKRMGLPENWPEIVSDLPPETSCYDAMRVAVSRRLK